jgi:Putative beta-barrel porin-2, OmpL-like. bbp2
LDFEEEEFMKTKQVWRGAVARAVIFFFVAVLIFAWVVAPRGYAQAQAGPVVQAARLSGQVQPASTQPAADAAAHDASTSGAKPAEAPKRIADPEALAKELEAMKQRIEQLEEELKVRVAAEQPTAADLGKPGEPALAVAATSVSAPATAGLTGWLAKPATLSASGSQPAGSAAPSPSADAAPPKKEKIEPFSDWDWTWLNGNPRNKDTAFDSKFFTPEIRADITYTYDFNKPVDDSMGGSSELFRSNEIQLEQLGIGGDFHYDNVRARFMTQFGMYSTATVRNDPSYSKGQWNIADADRYLAEAYGGYHINALNGINIDAGIFLSYIGLFSYYNFDNWAYQPSYVSSNTPWFFEGVRIQIFPNPHFKIEPWIINGWQSYGSANARKGLGGQIKWTPYPWLNLISNNYGLGHDDLYIPNRGRIHTDNSVEVKYYDKPGKTLDKMAFSFTGDLGCEFGPSTTTSTGVYLQGVGCHGNTKDAKSLGGDYFGPGINPKQSFVGWMLYDRTWFKKDTYGLTIGGGQINNPGRYLVLLPPINGETASSAAINAPYFTGNPSDPFKAWDSSFTFDYMPRQWLTFRWEYDYRHASVPYWSGKGGVTPPGSGGVPYTNNGSPQFFACNNGNTSGQLSEPLAVASCGAQGSTVWFPDLRRDEQLIDIDIMVKF